MALLGTYWHKFIAQTFAVAAGGALGGIQLTGLNHSLGTIPELVLPVPISISSVEPTSGWHGMFQYGGNASQATIGVLTGSVASYPTTQYDCHVAILHSFIR